MSVHVTGRVAINNGAAYLQLVPLNPSPRDMKPRPSPEDIIGKVKEGAITIHESRLPVTREVLNSALVTVQKRLKLATGMHGEWTIEADEVLAQNLASPKRGSASTPKPQKALLALPQPAAPLAIEDSKVEGEESDSDSSESSDSSSQSPAAKRAKKSSSSSSSSTPKATLRQRIATLSKECNDVVDAIESHQEIEAENEELRLLCDALVVENEELRAKCGN